MYAGQDGFGPHSTVAIRSRMAGYGITTGQAGGAAGTMILGPGAGTAIGSVVGSILGGLGGGANPHLRPQHKALVDFLLAARDTDGLTHIVNATFTGRSQGLYPTASVNYARAALGRVSSIPAIVIDQLQSLADAYFQAPVGTGDPYHQWENDRVNADLAAARSANFSQLGAQAASGVIPPDVMAVALPRGTPSAPVAAGGFTPTVGMPSLAGMSPVMMFVLAGAGVYLLTRPRRA